MTVGVRNWPRKPLSDRERTIRATLDRIPADDPCVFVPAGGGLQSAINNLPPDGGTICLEPGSYSGDITLPSTGGVRIAGASITATTLTGSVTATSAFHSLEHLWVFADGKSYGVKFGAGASSTARCALHKVRVGGNADGTGRAPSGDGPQVGLWLDGAILTMADQCIFASCNTGSGVYVNSTSNSFSTNVNAFVSCTMNSNATYGVQITEGGDGVSAMLLHSFIGGNMEDNASGEIKVDAAIGLRLQDLDFETTKTIGTQLDIAASHVVIENCHGVCFGGGAVTRFFELTTGRGLVRGNRISGNYTNADIGVLREGTNLVTVYDNQWWDPLGTAGNVTVTPRWVNNRSYWGSGYNG